MIGCTIHMRLGGDGSHFLGYSHSSFLQPIDVLNLEDEIFHPLNIRASQFKFPSGSFVPHRLAGGATRGHFHAH